ncbi:MAG: class I SAM-dependent methyltransferase [Hyphomicrobiaceae bacterium]
MTQHISPYHAPNFYADALAKGHHRDIVGGRWDETGRAQMALLQDAGLRPEHILLDIGAGSLRLGCKAVPYLNAENYWATDLSGALLRQGYDAELTDKSRLPPHHLIEDDNFNFPGVPDTITHALAFAVFTHLPMNHLRRALIQIRARFPHLQTLLFTFFMAPDAAASLHPVRQPDGVVTHDTRAPYHMLAADVLHLCAASGFDAKLPTTRLPRGQVLIAAKPR